MSNTIIPSSTGSNKAVANVELTELTEAECTFVSIVERGANRLPFKILKTDSSGEPTMWNLANLTKGKKKAQKADEAKIIGVLVKKSDELAVKAVTGLLATIGIDSTKSLNLKSDDVELTAFGQAPDDTSSVVRVNDGLFLVCKGIDWSSIPMNFNDYMATNLYDSLYAATNTFTSLFYDLVYEANNKDALKADVAKALQDFTSYITAVVDKLPENVIKFEKDLNDALLAEQATKQPETTQVQTEAKVVEATTEPVVSAPVVEATAPEAAKEPVAKSDDLTALIAQAMQPLQAQLQAITGQLGNVQKMEGSLQQLSSRVEAVAKVADSAQNTLSTTVAGHSPNGDPVQVAKSDDDEGYTGGLVDTAFLGSRTPKI